MSSEPENVNVITMGCRLNIVESEAIRLHVEAAGLQDCVVINTCAVTNEAVRQATQTIRRLKRERPDAKIIVTGCAAQVEPERFSAMTEVDHVIGNAEKLKAETYTQFADPSAQRVRVNDIMAVKETAGHLINGFAGRARAFIEVQNGCDHRCTFCIIPFGRGPSRSVPAGEVVSAIRRVVERGYNEAVLTGVDLTSYGRDLPGDMSLGRLVRHILKGVPELKRLRLSSIDQVEADDHLLRALAEEERLMPHLHLSLQSGDDMILKRMKRRHTRAQSIAFCETARRLRPDVVFGADLIAGFPTESDEMFLNSQSIVEACRLTYLHVFGFSPKKSTPAARMPQLHGQIIKERAARLRETGAEALSSFLSTQLARDAEVLVENGGIGRTPQFAEVLIGDSAPVGSLQRAHLSSHDGRRLTGTIAAAVAA